MLRIAIVDDLSEDRQSLAGDVRSYFTLSDVKVPIQTFQDARSFRMANGQHPFHLVFLDICMDEMDGISLSKLLRREDPDVLIVFVSTSREYAFDAFPVHPFDYLVKPYPREQLHEVLAEALRVLNHTEPDIEVRIPHASMKVQLSRISSLIAQGHAVELILTDAQRVRSIMTFSELSAQLVTDDRFLLLNRGVLINMDDVFTVHGDSVCMKTGESYPLRTRRRNELLSRFAQYQMKRMRKGRVS